MKIIHGISSLKHPIKNAVLTLGNFDGVHLGHRTIINETVAQAKKINGKSVICTFYPHPVKKLAAESCPPLIQTIEQRLEDFKNLNLDICIIEPFSFNFAHMTPKQFFHEIIVKKIGTHAIVVGYDFTFGLHRRGTASLLQTLGAEYGIKATIIEAQFLGELLISSTEIRHFVSNGKMEHANKLMGKPYTLRGKVKKGKGIGGSLGAHTANVEPENELLPMEGVYLTKTKIPKGNLLPSVASVGKNPTFPDSTFSVETHILNFKDKLVGKTIEILFEKRIRGQIAFDSPETLRGQIQRDIEIARQWHEKSNI